MESPQEYEKRLIAEMKGKTGKTLAEWMQAITEKNFAKRNDLIAWLKAEHGFGHANAAHMASLHKNNGKPIYGDSEALTDSLFAKSQDLRPVYNELEKAIKEEYKDAQFTPRKGYMSIHHKREFAVVAVKSKELRLGLDLANEQFTNELVPAKTLGAMPRYTHMVQITNSDLKGEWKKYLKQSYDRLHK